MTVELVVWAESGTVEDAASAIMEVTLIRADSDVTDASDDAGLQIESIALWGVFILILVGGVLVLLSILRTEEEEDEYANWGEDGYEDSLAATYGAVAAAPSIPTSMPAPAPEPAPSPASAPEPAAETGPPLPEGGLPAGWTMEQWNHYGQQWLDQNQQ